MMTGSGLTALSISACDASRGISSWIDAGLEGAWSRDVGGGGIGVPLTSPRRRRVMVS